MEHIGTLPNPNDVLSPPVIPLFGLLSSVSVENEEDCHFCLETITKHQLLAIRLPCCKHYVHAECFKTWASTSQIESIVRCAHCRAIYLYKDKCFLCLNTMNNTDKLTCTNCCHTKIHSECKKELDALVTLLTFDHVLECGQIEDCDSLWINI